MINLDPYKGNKLNQRAYEELLSTYAGLRSEDDLHFDAVSADKYLGALKFNFPLISSEESLTNWYQSSKYYKKYKDFLRLQKSWKTRKNSASYGETIANIVESQNLSLLSQLIEYSNKLSENYNPFDESIFIYLEDQFYLHIASVDVLILNASGIEKEVSLLYLCKQIVRHNILLLIKSKLKNLRLDIKQFFRNIIQFLFKNMDDESHVNSLFYQRLNERRLLIYLTKNKWKKKREFIISKIY